VSDEADAMLALIVLARGIVTAGSVGVGSASVVGGIGSGFGMVLPNEKPTLTTVLHVGTYARQMQSEGATWTAAAKNAVGDLEAWWQANAEAVELTKRQQVAQ
ncbi:MAG: hypothetical protein ACRD1T_27195, partial [Acidimicrobiia bacterium]